MCAVETEHTLTHTYTHMYNCTCTHREKEIQRYTQTHIRTHTTYGLIARANYESIVCLVCIFSPNHKCARIFWYDLWHSIQATLVIEPRNKSNEIRVYFEIQIVHHTSSGILRIFIQRKFVFFFNTHRPIFIENE